VESADDEDIEGAEGDIQVVDVPAAAGGSVQVISQSFTMSGDEEPEARREEDSESAAPAAPAESGGDGAGPPAAGGAVDSDA
jgi:hypothetical protein